MFNNTIITTEEMEALELNPEVSAIECLGQSGRYYNCYWYSITFNDGSDMDVYMLKDAYEAA